MRAASAPLSAVTEQALLARWRAVTDSITEPVARDRVARDLLARYAEPHRRYHDRRHLAEVLSALDQLGAGPAAHLAAWFHDAMYDPGRADNEERSADLATTALTSMGLPPAQVREVARLVQLTTAHDAADEDPDGAGLCDADLAILGADAERYDEYVSDVRAEYRHVSDVDFAAGRAAMLQDLAARNPLYRTVAGRQRWAAAARANLSREALRWRLEPPPADPSDGADRRH